MKRFNAFILSVILLISAFSVPAVAAQTQEDLKFERAKHVLSQLEIDTSINTDVTKNITRAEFVAMVVRMLNAEGVVNEKAYFTDCENNVFLSEINMAKNMGITSGTSLTTFSPDDNVVRNVAAKMLVTALGYEDLAMVKGGYPTGHMNVAQSVKLFDGVTSMEALSVRDAYVLIYNAIFANVAVMHGISSDNVVSSVSRDANVLTEYFKLEKTEGVIMSAGGDAVSANLAEQNTITVAGKSFKYKHSTEGLIGYSAEVWYNADEETAYVISLKKSNTTTVITKDDKPKYSSYVVKTNPESGRSRQYRLDDAYTFVLNGRGIAPSPLDFEIENGELKLIDNDGDGDYDFVVAAEAVHFVISAIDYTKEIIYDDKSVVKSISFDIDEDYFYSIEIEGNAAEVEDLKPDMVCSVFMSDDNKVCKIKASQKTTEGKITQRDEDGVTINGEVYKLSKYFNDVYTQLDFGTEYKFLISEENLIVAISDDKSSGMKYGYLLGYNDGTASGTDPWIKMLTEDNVIERYDLDFQIYLDGVRMNGTDNRVKTALINGTIPKYQVLRYMLKDGILTHLDTAEDSTSSWNVTRSESKNSLTKYITKSSVNYRSNVGFGIPSVSFSKAVIFALPSQLATNPNQKYDDSLFNVISKTQIGNDTTQTVDAFDFDENYIPQAITIYCNNGSNVNQTPSVSAQSYMVWDVMHGVYRDGEDVTVLKVYANGKYEEYTIDPASYDAIMQAGKMPTPGDVVRLAIGRGGYICGVALDVDYNEVNSNININYGVDGLTTSGKEFLQYFSGTTLRKSDEFVTLEVENAPADSVANGMITLCLTSPKYVVFNKETEEVFTADKNSVISALAAGYNNASHIVCKAQYYGVNTVYIYAE